MLWEQGAPQDQGTAGYAWETEAFIAMVGFSKQSPVLPRQAGRPLTETPATRRVWDGQGQPLLTLSCGPSWNRKEAECDGAQEAKTQDAIPRGPGS